MRAAASLALATVVGCAGPRATVDAPMSVHTIASSSAPTLAPDDKPISPPPSAAPDATVQQAPVALSVASAVERFYANAAPFECDFAIESFSKAHNTRASSQMHLRFLAPGELQAAFSTGYVIVVHARVFTMTEPKRSIVYQHSVPADFCPSALIYAAGVGALNGRLSLQAYPGTVMNAPSLDVLVGTPLRASPDVAKLVLYADGSGEVKRTLIVAPTGDRTRFDAKRCTTNVSSPVATLFAQSTVPGAATSSSTPAPPSSMTRALP